MAARTLVEKRKIPLINLETDTNLARSLDKALVNTGCAFLTNHGVSEECIDAANRAMRQFVDLPDRIKREFLRNPATNQGYVPPGVETLGVGKMMAEVRHSFNISEVMSQSNLVIDAMVPDFTKIIQALADELTLLENRLLKALAISLGVEESFFLDRHRLGLQGGSRSMTTLRLIYYPAVIEEEEGKGTRIRCGEHCDYGTITLLTQDSEGGLEIKLPGTETWERVGHLPGAIFLNTGELLSSWTRGKYEAVPHRVVIPEEEKVRKRARQSIVLFCHPDNEVDIIPLGKGATNERVLNALEHVQQRFDETYL